MHTQPDTFDIKKLIREEDDYFKRQPRVDQTKLNYNFEQFKRYTKLLDTAVAKDNYQSRRFYKMVHYVKENIDNLDDP